MPETKKYPTLVWLDLEMTGLDPDSERIIEIMVAATNLMIYQKLLRAPIWSSVNRKNSLITWMNGIPINTLIRDWLKV